MWNLRFLGVGNAHASALGNASAVLEIGGVPRLLIDCGVTVPEAYQRTYGSWVPEAIFITHNHLDHIAGLESLFYRMACSDGQWLRPRLYVPAAIVERLHEQLGNDPARLAEGGVNFWDCFQLTPVSDSFWHAGELFDVFSVQHHAYRSAFGLGLESRFLFTGDTRPIPEVLARFAANGETIFHDCALRGNPSHTGLGDLVPNYTPEQRRRLVLYHYESAFAGEQLRARGYRVALKGESFDLFMGDEDGLPKSA
jgi:ribonuclease BN (tRNA processing enzyme)